MVCVAGRDHVRGRGDNHHPALQAGCADRGDVPAGLGVPGRDLCRLRHLDNPFHRDAGLSARNSRNAGFLADDLFGCHRHSRIGDCLPGGRHPPGEIRAHAGRCPSGPDDHRHAFHRHVRLPCRWHRHMGHGLHHCRHCAGGGVWRCCDAPDAALAWRLVLHGAVAERW